MSQAETSRAPDLGNQAGEDRAPNAPEHSQELLRDVASIDTSLLAGVSVDDPHPAIEEPNMGLVRQAEHLEVMIADMTGHCVNGSADLESLTAAVSVLSQMDCCEASIADLGNFAAGTGGVEQQRQAAVETMLG